MVTNPTFLRVPDPTNGTGQLTQLPAVALDQTVIQWLREGALRVNSRSNPNPTSRLLSLRRSWRFSMVPSASSSVVNLSHSISPTLVRMFGPQFSNSAVLMQLRGSRLHVNEVLNCYRVYNIPPSSYLLPPSCRRLACAEAVLDDVRIGSGQEGN